MELIVLLIVVLLVVALLMRGGRSLGELAINAVVGVVLLLLTNLVLSPPIPITILTVLICAIGGVVGWLIILILYFLGVAL